jgi:hypothetical protein
MKIQLVLQFKPDEDLGSFDKLIAFEEVLSSLIGEAAEVDGDDFGTGELNIFSLTEVPLQPPIW